MLLEPAGFDTSGLSEAEEYEALHLWDLVDGLGRYAEDFEAAVEMLDIAERLLHQSFDVEDREQGLYAARRVYVPARDAAVTVYQFGWTLKHSIPDALRRCPTLSAKVSHETLKAARREFDDGFKTHQLLRNAVGHAAELSQTREAMERNASRNRAGTGGFFEQGNLYNRTLTYTIDGKVASLPITRDTLGTLVAITRKTFAGFAPVSWAA